MVLKDLRHLMFLNVLTCSQGVSTITDIPSLEELIAFMAFDFTLAIVSFASSVREP